ncbi:YqaE/Pmp3 family membrane protein [Neolewinella antarctica]|uniref:Uncharacterized membrane protein YqaE (UPF0057 family) n=1 Tax=Neolewinella antarctica TaxID=442734 RepID=A0ABX0X717_9BACT|nr:YqaE/Pmp3 family membrane protein [Neolewinella antarctica]NJC24647.1 uncharacterized membrane protein YqaE (UPF0057 family) [Neolewinella antarctica]
MRISTLFLLALMLLLATPNARASVIVNPIQDTEEAATEAEVLATAAAYKESLKTMTGKERRNLKRSQKRQLKKILKDQKDGISDLSDTEILLLILAVFIPPLAVYLHQGEINTKFWISLGLTLVFLIPGISFFLLFLPGIIYAILVILGIV